MSINFKPIDITGKKVSKRKILSYVHGIFDILGLISPLTMIGKVIFSKICLKKLRWDETIPVDIAKELEIFTKRLSTAKSIIFRRFTLADNADAMELHGLRREPNCHLRSCIHYFVWDIQ